MVVVIGRHGGVAQIGSNVTGSFRGEENEEQQIVCEQILEGDETNPTPSGTKRENDWKSEDYP